MSDISVHDSPDGKWTSFLFYDRDADAAYEAMYSVVTGWHIYELTDKD